MYRHEGSFVTALLPYYNRWDSHPDGFGLQVLREIPRNVSEEELEEGIRTTQEDLDAR